MAAHSPHLNPAHLLHSLVALALRPMLGLGINFHAVPFQCLVKRSYACSCLPHPHIVAARQMLYIEPKIAYQIQWSIAFWSRLARLRLMLRPYASRSVANAAKTSISAPISGTVTAFHCSSQCSADRFGWVESGLRVNIIYAHFLTPVKIGSFARESARGRRDLPICPLHCR